MQSSSFNKPHNIHFIPLSAHPRINQIKGFLQNLYSKKYSRKQIVNILMMFNDKYCWRRKQFGPSKLKVQYPYRALLELYSDNLVQICKLFAHALLKINPQPIILSMGSTKSKLNYKKQEILYIMLLMFFSLTPRQFSDGKQNLQNKFNHVNNFYFVLSNSKFKTQCIVQYLKIAVKQFLGTQKNYETFTILRNVSTNVDVEKIILESKQIKMSNLIIQANDRSIQQFNGQIKVDFANRFIGGGCLTYGCVQQEIMFATHPQLLVTTLLCQKMQDNQSLSFIGFKRYFNFKGYSNTTQFDGLANVKYQLTQQQQTRQFITAIDAIKFKAEGRQQFSKKMIDRQILKAYVGFSTLPIQQPIISGNWGCGVYNGDIQIKMIIQWIAASLAGKQLVICPFGKKKVYQEENFILFLKKKNIEETYKILQEICSCKLQQQYGKLSLFRIANVKVFFLIPNFLNYLSISFLSNLLYRSEPLNIMHLIIIYYL